MSLPNRFADFLLSEPNYLDLFEYTMLIIGAIEGKVTTPVCPLTQ